MIVCDFCEEEIPAGSNKLHVRAMIDNLPADKQVRLEGDLHPECLEPWYEGSRAIKGTRPTPA